MSFRKWLSIVTFILIALLLALAWNDIVHAWQLLSGVNMWILLLLVPLFLLNYFAVGEMVMSYLRQKGLLKGVKKTTQMRIALETNFVNHALPSGGASGMSYMTWRLNQLGVSASKGAMAQVVRTFTGFVAFGALLIASLVIVTADSGVNRWVILLTSTLILLMLVVIIGGIFMIDKLKRLHAAAHAITRWVNTFVAWVTMGRKKKVMSGEWLADFLEDMHYDYLKIRKDWRILIQPFMWSVVFIASDVLMFFVVFWSLGHLINPAALLIAYGVAMVAGMVLITPGGSGGYEALMVMVLAFTGVENGVGIAGVLLTRVAILLVIIVLGYVSYQQALIQYGKNDRPSLKRQ